MYTKQAHNAQLSTHNGNQLQPVQSASSQNHMRWLSYCYWITITIVVVITIIIIVVVVIIVVIVIMRWLLYYK